MRTTTVELCLKFSLMQRVVVVVYIAITSELVCTILYVGLIIKAYHIFGFGNESPPSAT
ncbi:unnamed protein product [Arabidopsis halleri]